MNHVTIDDAHNPIRNERRDSPTSNEDLAEWLDLAVPLAMAELAILPDAERAARIGAWRADAVIGLGMADALMFQAKRGRASLAASALAKGIAAEAALNGTAEHLGRQFVWPGARPPDRDPDADADDAGEWYGTHHVEVVQPREEYL